MNVDLDSTICATATPMGNGGIAVLRVSGKDAFKVVNLLLKKGIDGRKSHTLFFTEFFDKEGLIDEGVVSIFCAPHSYTGDHVVELSCHASSYIVRRLLAALVENGARMASPGEFTMRAFLNGRMDLSQAEAVADLIASENKASHEVAWRQLKGGISSEMAELRARLLDFASLIELELDFSEEEVEFAERGALRLLVREVRDKVATLRHSFDTGQALKEGVPVVLIGRPNAGKSTLLNRLLHEERALVSDIEGTTRDAIEEVWEWEGIKYRLIDTAGLREGADVLERAGIERTKAKMYKARLWLYLFDASKEKAKEAFKEAEEWKKQIEQERSRESEGEVIVGGYEHRVASILWVGNKCDRLGAEDKVGSQPDINTVYISAKTGWGMNDLACKMKEMCGLNLNENETILSNVRHYEVLGRVDVSLERVERGLDTGLSGDLLALDMREALNAIGEITGSVLADEVLGNIFGRFCIGK